jgi:hypothetical protein
MEVHFTLEQEAQILRAANATGTDAAGLVRRAALQFADDANFRAAVLEAKEYADRGNLLKKTRWTGVLKECSVPECAPGGRRPPSKTCRASAITRKT